MTKDIAKEKIQLCKTQIYFALSQPRIISSYAKNTKHTWIHLIQITADDNLKSGARL